MHKRLRDSQSGSILVMTALSMVVLFGVTALAVDAGYLYDTRNRMATAADAAARGATLALASSGCPGNCATLDNFGRNAAARHGFTNGVGGVTVTINHPPSAGPFAGRTQFVEAQVSQDVPTFFMRVMGRNTMSVGARAVAGGPATSFPCITTLKTGVDGLMQSGGTMLMPGCELKISGRMKLTGGALDLTGLGGAPDGMAYVNAACTGCPRIAPSGQWDDLTGVAYADPLASVPAPWDSTIDPCTGSSVGQSKSDGQGHTYIVRSTSRYTAGGAMLPGIYCGGIGIGGGGTPTTAAGMYILYGAPGSHSSFQTNTSGTLNAWTPPPEVTFYATGAPSTSFSAWKYPDHDMLQINPSGTVNLKAPTTGPWAGILFFQDRNWATPQNSQITGGGSTNLEGIIYISNTGSLTPSIRFSGGSGGSWVNYTMLVVPSMVFTGGSVLKNNLSAVSGGVFLAGTKIAQ